jgi:hypothetical protein
VSASTFSAELSFSKLPPFDQIKGEVWNVPCSLLMPGKTKP